jgi:hypothetical protein
MKRLLKFTRLSSTDRLLLIKATVLLTLVRLALWVLPFPTLLELLNRRPPAVRAEVESSPKRIAWAVAKAGRYVPKATCLAEAATAQLLFQAGGLPASLRIGVTRGEQGELKAHAWLEHHGEIVLGRSEEAYTPLQARPEQSISGRESCTS